jgi:hypothetical protein
MHRALCLRFPLDKIFQFGLLWDGNNDRIRETAAIVILDTQTLPNKLRSGTLERTITPSSREAAVTLYNLFVSSKVR